MSNKFVHLKSGRFKFSPNVMVGYLENTVWNNCRSYLSEFCSRVCKRWCKNRKVLKIFEEVGKGGLDFVAYKNKKIWIVEVKTGTHSELKQNQKQFVERLGREMGIALLHFHVSLNDEIDYSVRCKSRRLPQEDFEPSSP